LPFLLRPTPRDGENDHGLTINCPMDIVHYVKAFGGKVRYTWKILLSGYAPLYAYELGLLDTSVSFEELKKSAYVNPKAHAIGNDPEFSRKIREDRRLPVSR
jgi:hypothetical protein